MSWTEKTATPSDLGTFTIRPKGQYGTNDWLLIGALPKWQAVNNTPPDDARYLYTLGGGNVQCNFNFQDPVVDLGITDLKSIYQLRPRTWILASTPNPTEPHLRFNIFDGTTQRTQQDLILSTQVAPATSALAYVKVNPDPSQINMKISEISGAIFGETFVSPSEIYIDGTYIKNTEKTTPAGTWSEKNTPSGTWTERTI